MPCVSMGDKTYLIGSLVALNMLRRNNKYFDFFLPKDHHVAHRTYLAFLCISLWASAPRNSIYACLSHTVSNQQNLPRSHSQAM